MVYFMCCLSSFILFKEKNVTRYIYIKRDIYLLCLYLGMRVGVCKCEIKKSVCETFYCSLDHNSSVKLARTTEDFCTSTRPVSCFSQSSRTCHCSVAFYFLSLHEMVCILVLGNCVLSFIRFYGTLIHSGC